MAQSSNLTKEQETKLLEFAGITGASPEVATKFLEGCSWNAEVAVNRFFTNPSPDQFNISQNSAFGNNNNNNNAASSSSGTSSMAASGSASSSGTGGTDQASLDAALARQLAQQDQQNGIGSGSGSGAYAPQAQHPMAAAFGNGILSMFGITPQQAAAQAQRNNMANVQRYGGGMGGMGVDGRIYSNDNGSGAYDAQSGVRQADQAFSEQMLPSGFDPNGAHDRRMRVKDSLRDFSNEWQQGSSGSGRKKAKQDQLAKMFAEPPYRFQGDLEAAKQAGQTKNAWILVNIQSADDFVSHCLNRDVWNDSEFSEICQACFILYQWTKEQSRGQKFVNLYHIAKVPCLCIIDPNTGRKEHEFALPDSPVAVVKVKDEIIHFLDKHPNPKAKPKKVVPVAPSSKQQVVSHEDQLLQQAMMASLADAKEDEMSNNNNNNSNSNDNSTNVGTNATDKEDVDIDLTGNDNNNNNNSNNNDNSNNNQAQAQAQEPAQKKQEYKLDPEPAPGNRDGTALRIRMPDGQLLQRRFLKEGKVQQIYTYIYVTAGRYDVHLFTPMPRVSLDDSKDKTLKEMHLERATIACSFDD